MKWRVVVALSASASSGCDSVCALNSALREALNAFFAVLSRYTIADLVAARPNVRHLLGIDLLEQRAPAA